MWVKICGTTNLEDARLALQGGADALGFLFAPSKRRMTPEQAAGITDALRGQAEMVGVFADGDAEAIASDARQAGLTAVQLHGSHRPELTHALKELLPGIKLIQTVSVEVERGSMEALRAELETVVGNPGVWAVLLDSAKAGASGGLGVTFPWAEVAPVVQAVWRDAGAGQRQPPHLLLAGGLRAENVAEATRTLRPWGVDVCSGVEGSPGKKSAERLQAFLAAASAREPLGTPV